MVVQQQPQHGLDAEFLQFRQDSAEAFKRDRFVLAIIPTLQLVQIVRKEKADFSKVRMKSPRRR